MLCLYIYIIRFNNNNNNNICLKSNIQTSSVDYALHKKTLGPFPTLGLVQIIHTNLVVQHYIIMIYEINVRCVKSSNNSY